MIENTISTLNNQILSLVHMISYPKTFLILVTFTVLIFLSLSKLVDINAGIIVCPDSSLCISTNMSDVTIGDKFSNQSILGLNETAIIIGSEMHGKVSGGNSPDEIIGSHGDDIIGGGSGSDKIMGGTGNDNISGGSEADEIMGGEGNNTINGDHGPDSIMGGPSDDIIMGGMGSDSMTGHEGNDMIYQGTLNSTAADRSVDIIDCGDGEDKVWINLSIDEDQVNDSCEIIHKG